MGVESYEDLALFFDTSDFGTEATINGGTIVGIIDSAAATDRPGANSRSSASPWIAGAADVSITRLQFATTWHSVSAVKAEDTLTIAAGAYAGSYRVKDIQRDGELCRLILNAR